MDTAMRTLRPETSKRGRPNTLRLPSSAGSSQKDLDAPIPKELDLPSLEGGMLGVRIGKQSPNWQWLKDKDGEGNGTPLQYSCLENPMGGGAW